MSTNAEPRGGDSGHQGSSMELLQRLFDEALDPKYQELDAQPSPRAASWRLLAFMTCLLVGVMIAATALNSGSRAGAAGEREAILQRIAAAEQAHDRLQQQVAQLRTENEHLRQQAGAGGQQASAPLKLSSASSAVSGPGIVLTIQEGVRRDDGRRERSTTVLDTDLRMVVNGLWEAGAEAISINGQRVSTRTAIRSAGSAITVNYRSLNPPYRIEAIGDPKHLPAAFASTGGGAWLSSLRDNYAVTWSLHTAEKLELAADTGIRADQVKPGQ